MGKFKKSLAAPTAFVKKVDHLIIGDKYVRNMLVTQLPEEFGFGMLSYLISNPNIKVSIKTKILEIDLTSAMKKEYKDKVDKFDSTSDPTLLKKLENQIIGYRNHIDDIVNNNDKMLDFLMILTITADNIDDLNFETKTTKSKLNIDGIKLTNLSYLQEQLMRATSPLFIDDNLDSTLLNNYGIPITARSFAGMWAYNYQSLLDPKGFLLGKEKNNDGMIKWDPNFYRNEKEKSVLSNRLTSNIMVVGASGSGKTTLINKIVRIFIKDKRYIVWIDPENKNRYMTKKYNGQYINWGMKGNQINMFDLKPVSCEDDEDIDRWDTEVAIYSCIDEIKTILKLYHHEIAHKLVEGLNEIDQIIINTYESKGITFETEFKGLGPKDFPILSDFKIELEKEINSIQTQSKRKDRLEQILNAINPMTLSDKYYFDGYTTIDMSNYERKMLSFGTRGLKEKGQGIKNALNYIMFKYAWSRCLSDEESVFIYDESQEVILEGTAAKEFSTFFRRSRKYGNTSVLGTQEPKDLNSDVMVDGVAIKTHGLAIVNNTTYKFIMHLENDAVEQMSKLVRLTELEKDAILGFKQGDAIFICGKDKYSINVMASAKELKEMDPGINS